MVEVSENVREFLEEFEKACKKRGGTVTRGTFVRPIIAGEHIDYEYVACLFKDKSPPVEISVGGVHPSYYSTKFNLSMCFGEAVCASALDLNDVDIFSGRVGEEKPEELPEKPEKLCGYLTFVGIFNSDFDKMTVHASYEFSPEDGLKGIVVYARENQIALKLYQQKQK
jgi:hypothetical protein